MANAAGIITDPSKDIAINENLVEMRVNIQNRQILQKIYVFTTDGRVTTKQYIPDDDTPANWIPTLTPSKNELALYGKKKHMLVVGLCLLDNPKEHILAGTDSKTEAKDKQKAKESILTRPDRVSLVVVEITPFVRPKKHLHFYILCNPVLDVHQIKRITRDAVFFFREMWPENVKTLQFKFRRIGFTDRCKMAAAEIKESEPGTGIRAGSSKDPNWLTTKELKVSTLENLGIHLALQFDAWKRTRNDSIITAMGVSLKGYVSQVKDKPTSGSYGIQAFYDEKEEYTIESCEMMLAELKSYHKEFPDCEPVVIKKIRDSLQRQGLIQEIPRNYLVRFLMMVEQDLDEGNSQEKFDSHAELYVRHIKIDQRCQTWRPIQTAMTLEKDDHALLIAGLLEGFESIARYIRTTADNIKEAHGGFQNWSSIEELMAQIGKTVDVATLKVLVEQVLAIRVGQLVATNMQAAERVDDMIQLLKNYQN